MELRRVSIPVHPLIWECLPPAYHFLSRGIQSESSALPNPSREGSRRFIASGRSRLITDTDLISLHLCRELVACHALHEGRGWHEEEIASDSTAEVQQFVVVAGRPADEHVLQHLLDGTGRTAVADEECAELSLGSVTEGHVIA